MSELHQTKTKVTFALFATLREKKILKTQHGFIFDHQKPTLTGRSAL